MLRVAVVAGSVGGEVDVTSAISEGNGSCEEANSKARINDKEFTPGKETLGVVEVSATRDTCWIPTKRSHEFDLSPVNDTLPNTSSQGN